ncbi:MAG: peptidase M20, partial [Vicinamibacterales bacterium]
MNVSRLLLVTFILAASAFNTGLRAQWSASAIETETMQHFQGLLRLDTTSPPGNERRAVEYLEQVFKREGIPYQVFAKDPQRPNLVARIKGNGKKRPILV